MLLALAALASPAHAFCGTFVGDADSDLLNSSSQVILARDGDTTTLTLVNDYQGALNQFAMLVPVPQVLDENDVRVLAPWVVDAVDSYSGPRLVSYTCEDFHDHWVPRELGCGAGQGVDDSASTMSSSDWADTGSYDTVNVEAEFEVGEYQIVVLSAQESSGLLGWLTGNGYFISADTEDLLQEYIDGGSYFFAAKVDLSENLGSTMLSPLQVAYQSDGISLPIRLGTVNSPGEQDLVIYGLTDFQDGRLGIANYAEREVDDNDCMLGADDDLDSHYADAVGDVLSGTEEAGWLFEYGWAPYHCDPCVDGEALDDALVRELGFSGGSFQAYFSRLRMRYTPDQATEDLVLYTSNITDTTQLRFIQYDESFEDRFEVCGQGFVDDPGDCEDEWSASTRQEKRDQGRVEGCAALDGRNGGLALVLGLGALIGLRRRRH